MRQHVVSADIALPASATTTNSTVTVPAGAIVTGIQVYNNGTLTTAGNFTVVVDTVAQMTAAAAVLTTSVFTRYTANATAKTVVATNGGLIGILTSAATTGSVTVILTYIL